MPLAPAIRMLQALEDEAVEILERLNEAYIQAYLTSDTAAFDELVAEDFLVTLADGRILGKALFLSLAARPAGVIAHQVEDIRIRLYGDCGIVTATTLFTRVDGTEGETRYTDVYAKVDGRWRVVTAHLTSVSSAS